MKKIKLKGCKVSNYTLFVLCKKTNRYTALK